MSVVSSNPFAALSEDGIPAVPVLKKATEPKKPTEPKKTPNVGAQRANNDRRVNDQQRPTGRGRGGRVSAPRAPRESNTEDFTGGNPAQEREQHRRPRPDSDRPRRGRPDGGNTRGRQFDRRSATGRVDGEKKDVAGHSWGNPVDAAGVMSGEPATAAAETAENVEATTDATETMVETKPVEEEDKTKSFAEYQKEIAARKALLKAKPSRKANEGVDESAWKDAKQLAKNDIEADDDIAILLNGSKKSASHKKKERKEKELVDINVRFNEDASRREFRGERDARRGGRGGAQRTAPRNSGNKGTGAANLNINDTSSFPSLA